MVLTASREKEEDRWWGPWRLLSRSGRAPPRQTHFPAPWTPPFSVALGSLTSSIQEFQSQPSRCSIDGTHYCLALPSQTLLSPHTHSEIKLLHSPVCFSISKIWSKYSFPFTRGADSTCSIEVVEGVPLHKSNKADFAVIKFYKVTLTLSWSGLLQTALLINHSRVLTFPDINNTAAPWPEQKGGNGRGFTLSFPLGYLQTSFSSCVWENVKPVFLFICTKTFFILSWTCALCHLALPHGWGDLTLGSDEGHALTRGILTDLTDGGYEGV